LCGLCTAFIDITDDVGGTLLGERQAGRSSDSRRPASDKHDLSGEAKELFGQRVFL
jgi:hypothetical protein